MKSPVPRPHSRGVAFFCDRFGPRSPPPDERPAGGFPQVFLTPRALYDIFGYQRKRGGTACALVVRTPDLGFDVVITP